MKLKKDIKFHAHMRPGHATGADGISLTGYKHGLYLTIIKSGCCWASTQRLEIPLYDGDFDTLIGMLKRAKAAVREAAK